MSAVFTLGATNAVGSLPLPGAFAEVDCRILFRQRNRSLSKLRERKSRQQDRRFAFSDSIRLTWNKADHYADRRTITISARSLMLAVTAGAFLVVASGATKAVFLLPQYVA